MGWLTFQASRIIEVVDRLTHVRVDIAVNSQVTTEDHDLPALIRMLLTDAGFDVFTQISGQTL